MAAPAITYTTIPGVLAVPQVPRLAPSSCIRLGAAALFGRVSQAWGPSAAGVGAVVPRTPPLKGLKPTPPASIRVSTVLPLAINVGATGPTRPTFGLLYPLR